MELARERGEKLNMLMTNRDLERQLNIQKRKDDKDLISADNEKLEFFEKIFEEKQTLIKNNINNSSKISKLDLPDHFNTISKEILTLQKYVAASNIFLRNYDLKKCQESLQELTLDAKMLEDQLLPKKKFGFKSKLKQKPQGSKLNGHGKTDQLDSSSKPPKFVFQENFCGYSNKNNENFVMNSEEIHKKDVFFEKLNSCKVELYGSPSTLHLNHLKDCTVFSGPVSTSIFAENCENCILVIACQQLRLHSSKNVKIYLHVTSRAIMEDCVEICIAPYNWTYKEISNDFKRATLDMNVNNWTSIDDFNWLNIEKHSPNWKEINEEDRVQQWNNV